MKIIFFNKCIKIVTYISLSDVGIVVSIAAFQAVDPGSIPGHRRKLIFHLFFIFLGCPSNAFCDYGICRCDSGYDARYGSCWNSMDSFNANQESWNRRQMPGFNPHISCSAHSQCRNVDMNMICNDKNSTCQCRETMQWNDEALECQIFIVSVDFTNFFSKLQLFKKNHLFFRTSIVKRRKVPKPF